MNRTIIITIHLLFVSMSSLAQNSVRGQVLDAETNIPLANATVFVANTTKGTSTDTEGKFEIDGLPGIHYNMVVSFLGYEPVVFDVVPGSANTYIVKLKASVKVLDEVVVKAKRLSKVQLNQYLKIFRDNFIGFSENAKQCKLENEGSIVFAYENDVLLAFCDKDLLIKNEGLGYRIKILLQRYEFNSRKNSVLYEGQMVYEPLKPINFWQERAWAKNRLKAYYGSEMHFFRALYKHRLNEEGFYFYFPALQGSDSLVVAKSPLSYDSMRFRTIMDYSMILDRNKSPGGYEVLRMNYPLLVLYINEAESPAYQRKRELLVQRAVQMSHLTCSQPAVVFPDGRAYPIEAVEVNGYWGWELISEALPLDYDPAEDVKMLSRKWY